MNKLKLLKKGIFGDSDSLKNLEEMECAVLLLLSDSHGDSEAVINVFKNCGAKADALLFSGDGLQDMLHIINTAAYDAKLRDCLPSVLFLVSGNSDSLKYTANLEAASKIPSLQKNPEKILKFDENLFLNICGSKILLTHGHEFFVDYELSPLSFFTEQNGCGIAVYGHTHVPRVEKVNSALLINPGSVSRPRCGSKKSFAFLTLEKNKTPRVDFMTLDSFDNL